MASGESDGQRETTKSRWAYWRRVLRPLYWWLLLVLVLYVIRTHERWIENTRIDFTVTLAGKAPFPEVSATFDGQPILSHQKIPLGRHQFTVTHSKGETYSTNLFVWYGAHDFGVIDLKRTMSVLSVSADPPAPMVSIHGPEFDVKLTNSPGLTSSVPTDRYVITSQYAHWSHSDEVLVAPGLPATWRIAPRLGAAQITCNKADATGKFMAADGQVIEFVVFPYAIAELPEGSYTVTAQYHNDVLSRTVNIKAGTTNTLSLTFLYGSAVLKTEPSGATVRTEDGRNWGVTPLTVNELKPGSWTFVLRQDGYEAATASLVITTDQATSFQSNLVSVNYTGRMKAARQAMENEDYDGALKTTGDALIAKSGDADALTLQHNAIGLGSLKRAKKLGTQGDFMGGEKELATTLGIFPENTEAKALLAEYKRREPEQREKMRLERLERGNVVFKDALKGNSDADLFEQHEFKTTKPVDQVYAAILNALKVPPAFNIVKNYSPASETFEIQFVQDFSTYLATIAGRRQGVIVMAQTKDDETQILFMILEYTTEAQVKFSIGNLIGTPVAVNYVPISPARLGQLSEKLQARLNEGLTNVAARIHGAIAPPLPPSLK